MQLIRSLSIALVAGVSVAVVACQSGSYGYGFGGGAGQDSVGVGEIPGTAPDPGKQQPPPFEACPTSVPMAGTACNGRTCEYGTSPDPACNVIAFCDSFTRAWFIENPVHCPTSCPQRFDERVPGAECNDPDVCTYLEATCGCAGAIVPPETTGDAGNDGSVDATDDGAAADAGAAEAGPPKIGHWQCIRPGGGCPARQPRVGTSCAKSMTCDYGTCVFGVPLTYECASGTWSSPTTAQACP